MLILFLKTLSFFQNLSFVFFSYSTFGGCDKMNALLIILLPYIFIIRFLATNFTLKSRIFHLNQILKGILMILFLFFYANSIFSLYIYFELSVLPIFMIIIGWGYQTERVRASLALIFYTVAASIPLLIFLLNRMFFYKFFFLRQWGIKINFNTLNIIILVRTMLAFLVKIPIFLGHLWLPKAHVEAPVIGSIILAAVLLKLGGYGLIRIAPLFSSNFILNLVISISLTGSGLIGFICLNQLDIKVIIAYSSVAHIGLVIGGILYLSNLGLRGAIILIIAHGVRSSIIFFGGNILYSRRFSRRIVLSKGLLVSFPLISFFWLFSSIRRIAAPPMVNLIAEILCIVRILRFRVFNVLWMGLSVFLAGAYSIVLYSRTQQSPYYARTVWVSPGRFNELLIFFRHVFWALVLILSLNLFY